ncbi:MAG: hypothetical protein KAS87_06525 [Candidatus Omnitrophica bacterium]|nr:hypothetical protein [Candidatus Omnitrophota bacterium]
MTWKKLAFFSEVATLGGTAVDADHAAATAGTVSTAARADHKHDLTAGAAASLSPVDGSSEALGTSNAVPHLDHVHGLGPLVANLDFAEYEADSFKLETQATEPTTGTVAGRMYYNSSPGTIHPFVYQ